MTIQTTEHKNSTERVSSVHACLPFPSPLYCANAAARRASRPPLATHRAPLYCAARRRTAPAALLCLLCPCPAQPGTALLCPGLDWTGPGRGLCALLGAKCASQGCVTVTRPNSMQVRTSVRTLDAPRSWHGCLLAHLACVACVACASQSMSSPQASCPACNSHHTLGAHHVPPAAESPAFLNG